MALTQRQLANWARQQLAEGAFRRLAPHFLDAGLPLAPVKGFALGRWLYKDISQRALRDVDLLVAEHQIDAACRVAQRAGWPITYESRRLREVVFYIDEVAIEIHGEIGRRHLSGLKTADVLGRASRDTETFDFETLRIDDVDHFLLLVANVIKDRFTGANEHAREDLCRLWLHVEPQIPQLLERAQQAGFTTALASTFEWLVAHGSDEFARVKTPLVHQRRAMHAALRYLQREPMDPRVGLFVVCAVNDRHWNRLRCVAHLLRSGLERTLRS